jgi:hypothetical protein
MPETDPIFDRLEDQIKWYDNKSVSNQRTFRRFKVIEIVAAALIPFLPALPLHSPYSSWATGGLGLLITVIEGLLHLNKYQENWISYRSTCEALRHEKYLYLGKASFYATAQDPHALLAERVESLVSQEHAKWVSAMQKPLPEWPDEGRRRSGL